MSYLDEVIYLDYNATTPLASEAFAAMEPHLRASFANAASKHVAGQEAARHVENARAEIATFIGARPQELIFTSGATESNNLAIFGTAAAEPARRHMVTVATEHKAVLEPLAHLARQGYDVTVLPVDSNGHVSPENLRNAIRDNTLLVSVMAANNETGTVQPIEELGSICRDAGVLFHTDAAQLVGKLPIDLEGMPIDLLSFTAHKLYGPKGVGALFVRRHTRLIPAIVGGGQERGLRGGTMNVPGIVGFGAAAQVASSRLTCDGRHFELLRRHLLAGLQASFSSVEENGHPTRRLPSTLNVRLRGLDADELQAATPGVAISSGSACTSATPEPSHVLQAMGLGWEGAQECLRFGLGRPTTIRQIDEAIVRLLAGAARLRGPLPLLNR